MHDFLRRAPLHAKTAAAATSHPLASCEALAVLRAGGSAADAAIAAATVLAVAEPHMTGVGGDCFALVLAPAQNAPAALNGSGWTPKAETGEDKNPVGETSPRAVTVPGAVAAWKKLHNRFGKLPWRGLFTAAIRYAAEGCPVAKRVAHDWQESAEKLQQHPETAALFLPGGKPPNEGELHRQPQLAQTLAAIADDGGRSFYRGAIAQEITATLQEKGGVHQLSDFAEYRPQWQTPLAGEYRNWQIWQCPPNTQGATVLLMLAAMAQTPDWQTLPPPARAVRFANITRLAYHWRDNNIGDDRHSPPCHSRESGNPAVNNNNPDNTITHYHQTIKKEAARIAKAAAKNEIPNIPPPPPAAEHKDTVYLAAIDANGLCVSFINSLFHPFGSGILAPKSGVLLHSRGSSFVPEPGHPNCIAPRKRPLHTIIPAIAKRGEETAAFGVMGGHFQAAGQAWFLNKWLDEGCDLQQAMDAPRFFNYPDRIHAEPFLGEDIITALQKTGNKIEFRKAPLGGGQAVHKKANGTITAASDPRKPGIPVGY